MPFKKEHATLVIPSNEAGCLIQEGTQRNRKKKKKLKQQVNKQNWRN